MITTSAVQKSRIYNITIFNVTTFPHLLLYGGFQNLTLLLGLNVSYFWTSNPLKYKRRVK